MDLKNHTERLYSSLKQQRNLIGTVIHKMFVRKI